MSKRKTIVQRAEAVKEYPKPRNVIIQYEAPQIRVIRQFQRLGITLENPQAYIQRYGAALFDSQALVQQARAAGVVEDIVRRSRHGHRPMIACLSFSPRLRISSRRELTQQDSPAETRVVKQRVVARLHRRLLPQVMVLNKVVPVWQTSNQLKAILEGNIPPTIDRTLRCHAAGTE